MVRNIRKAKGSIKPNNACLPHPLAFVKITLLATGELTGGTRLQGSRSRRKAPSSTAVRLRPWWSAAMK